MNIHKIDHHMQNIFIVNPKEYSEQKNIHKHNTDDILSWFGSSTTGKEKKQNTHNTTACHECQVGN